MKVYTIGFTKKPARRFFGLIQEAGPKRIVDVRLNNISQLAGFAKKDDLAYFAQEICGIGYVHLPMLAPSQEILDEYKKHGEDWKIYEVAFLKLLNDRAVERTIAKDVIDDACLLCSEDSASKCHRRLVAEYFQQRWGDLEIVHLR